jgi:hypothetical protein
VLVSQRAGAGAARLRLRRRLHRRLVDAARGAALPGVRQDRARQGRAAGDRLRHLRDVVLAGDAGLRARQLAPRRSPTRAT